MNGLGVDLFVKIVLSFSMMVSPLQSATNLSTIDACDGSNVLMPFNLDTKEPITAISLVRESDRTAIVSHILSTNTTEIDSAFEGRVIFNYAVMNSSMSSYSYTANITLLNITSAESGTYRLRWINVNEWTQVRRLNVNLTAASTIGRPVLRRNDCKMMCSLHKDVIYAMIVMTFIRKHGSNVTSTNGSLTSCDEGTLLCCVTWDDACAPTNQNVCASKLMKACDCSVACKPEMGSLYVVFLAMSIIICIMTVCKKTVKKGWKTKVAVIPAVITCVPLAVILILVYVESERNCSGNVCLSDCGQVLILIVLIGIAQVLCAIVFRYFYKKAPVEGSKMDILLTDEKQGPFHANMTLNRQNMSPLWEI